MHWSPLGRITGLAGRNLRAVSALSLIITATLAVSLGWLPPRAGVQALLIVDQHPLVIHAYSARVEDVLRAVGLRLGTRDIVVPSPASPVSANTIIQVFRARPFRLEVDGQVLTVESHASRLDVLLAEAGITLGPHDQVFLENRPVGANAVLTGGSAGQGGASPPPKQSPRRQRIIFPTPRPLRISIRRARPFTLHDGQVSDTLYSTATTVGQALWEHGITLYAGDRVSPALSSPLWAGLDVYIQRSQPVEILVDGRHIRTRTQAVSVGELLSELGIALVGQDRVEPAEDTPVTENLTVRVTRLREEVITEEEPIPFQTLWQPDGNLELDQQELQQAGAEGLLRRRVRVQYEDGQETARSLEDEWVEREPTDKIIRYGTKIVIRELEAPDGTIHYWRRIRMLATSYTAATSGKAPDHPEYGITFLGWQMRAGIVAVDPSVIPLRTEVYVPGYGKGVAADTGGAIKGRRIDLGYDEDNLKHWYKWVDVYLLAPPPPANKIRWVLPNWPTERK
ncbi:MAG: ubiquitin-like domain-containing protein [Anaerolineae bacterium]